MSDVLNIDNLNVYYGKNHILKDVNLKIAHGEIVGLLGESGCGKSTLAKTICGLLKKTSGEIYLDGKPQMIFQDPYGSLNPSMRIGRILEEPLRINTKLGRDEINKRVREMAERTGIDLNLLDSYPNELSGGQRQRVSITLSLMLNPALVIADEPVSALDVTIQKKVLTLLYELNRDFNVGMLFISHDIKVIYEMCSYIYIMKDGMIVEDGTDEEIFKNPKEQYTKTLLLSAM